MEMKFVIVTYLLCMHGIEVSLRGIAHGIGRSNWAKGRALLIQ